MLSCLGNAQWEVLEQGAEDEVTESEAGGPCVSGGGERRRTALQVKRLGDTYLVRLEKGERVIESLKQFADSYRLGFGVFQAIGTFERVTLGYYNTDTQAYENEELDEPVEVLSMIGDISLGEEGERIVHAHVVVVGRSDYSALGGHVTQATAGPTVEVVVETSPTTLRRSQDPETGLQLWDLSSGETQSA